MAEISGAHVELGVSVKTGGSDLFYPIWSETITPGATTGQVAGGMASLKDLAQNGVPVFRVRAHGDGPIFVAKGKTPDASQIVSSSDQTVRAHLMANELRDIPAMPGDRLQVVVAN